MTSSIGHRASEQLNDADSTTFEPWPSVRWSTQSFECEVLFVCRMMVEAKRGRSNGTAARDAGGDVYAYTNGVRELW